MRIAILGYSGSGKSTLAKYLGKVYEIPVLYLDKVQFLAGWKERDRTEALGIVTEFMKQESWVIDGNYTAYLQEQRLKQADHIVFMNFSRIKCFVRAYKRYFKYHNTSRDSMAEGCKEKMDPEFIWWILYKGRTKQKRQHYNKIIKQYKDKTTVLKSQKQLSLFMKELFDTTSEKDALCRNTQGIFCIKIGQSDGVEIVKS